MQVPEKELRPEHECPDCNQIVYVLCGVLDEVRDKYVCGCRDVKMKEMIINSSQVIGIILTITQSTSNENYKEIPNYYFVTKHQKVNKKYQ